jgi:hypothetical protein
MSSVKGTKPHQSITEFSSFNQSLVSTRYWPSAIARSFLIPVLVEIRDYVVYLEVRATNSFPLCIWIAVTGLENNKLTWSTTTPSDSINEKP